MTYAPLHRLEVQVTEVANNARKSLTAWATERLMLNPATAFEHGSDALRAAARCSVNEEVRAWIENGRAHIAGDSCAKDYDEPELMEEIRGTLYQAVMNEVRSPTHSTSPLATETARQVAAEKARLLEDWPRFMRG